MLLEIRKSLGINKNTVDDSSEAKHGKGVNGWLAAEELKRIVQEEGWYCGR